MKEANGQEFFTFGIRIPVSGRDGVSKDLDISVSHDGGKGKAAMFTTGRRVAIKGVLTVRKKGGKRPVRMTSRLRRTRMTSPSSPSLPSPVTRTATMPTSHG